jgi:hypothetical protein
MLHEAFAADQLRYTKEFESFSGSCSNKMRWLKEIRERCCRCKYLCGPLQQLSASDSGDEAFRYDLKNVTLCSILNDMFDSPVATLITLYLISRYTLVQTDRKKEAQRHQSFCNERPWVENERWIWNGKVISFWGDTRFQICVQTKDEHERILLNEFDGSPSLVKWLPIGESNLVVWHKDFKSFYNVSIMPKTDGSHIEKIDRWDEVGYFEEMWTWNTKTDRYLMIKQGGVIYSYILSPF